MGFFHEAESWVLVAFILFVGLLVYMKVPAMATRARPTVVANVF